MGEILIPRRTKVELGYELLADIEVTPISGAVTSVDITGLNIGKGDEVVLVGSIVRNATAVIYTYINNNVTNSNYYRQRLTAYSTSIEATRANDSYTAEIGTSGVTPIFHRIKLTNNNIFLYQCDSIRQAGTTAPYLYSIYGCSTFTLTAISQITLTASATNAIGIGSRFQLYRIGGA